MATIALSQQTGHLNAAPTVTVTGTGTAWTPGTPGSPTFTLSGGTGASITAQTVVSATVATLTLATGSSTGVLTITDPSTGATATITLRPSTYHKWYPGLARRPRRR